MCGQGYLVRSSLGDESAFGPHWPAAERGAFFHNNTQRAEQGRDGHRNMKELHANPHHVTNRLSSIRA
jgi:hypothetical protein